MSSPPPLPNRSITWRIRQWAAIWATGTLVGVLLAALVSLVWDGDVTGPEFFFFVALPAQSIGQVLALAVGLSKLGARMDRDLGFDIRPSDLRVAPFAILNVIALSFLLNPVIEPFDITDQSQAELDLFGSAGKGALFVGVIVAVGFAPIYEELLFRGMLQRALANRLGRIPTMLSTAAIFGLVHLVTVDTGLDQWAIHAALVVISVGWLGLVLSWLADRDGRLGRAMVFHSTHNLLVIVATLAAGSDSLVT